MRRAMLLGLNGLCLGAMGYVAAYQTRAVKRLFCPVWGHGCEAVADAPFAHPFGIPDALLGFGLYAALFALALVPRPSRGLQWGYFGLAALNLVANAGGVRDMSRLGQYCFWCSATAVLSAPILLLTFPGFSREPRP